MCVIRWVDLKCTQSFLKQFLKSDTVYSLELKDIWPASDWRTACCCCSRLLWSGQAASFQTSAWRCQRRSDASSLEDPGHHSGTKEENNKVSRVIHVCQNFTLTDKEEESSSSDSHYWIWSWISSSADLSFEEAGNPVPQFSLTATTQIPERGEETVVWLISCRESKDSWLVKFHL